MSFKSVFFLLNLTLTSVLNLNDISILNDVNIHAIFTQKSIIFNEQNTFSFSIPTHITSMHETKKSVEWKALSSLSLFCQNILNAMLTVEQIYAIK